MLLQVVCDDCSFFHLQDADEHLEARIRRANGHVNVLVDTGHLFRSDMETFFGPVGDDVFVVVPAGTTWAQLLAGLGCFPSVSQARNNGWNKPIEDGFSPTVKVGKAHRKFITVFAPTNSHDAEGLKIRDV